MTLEERVQSILLRMIDGWAPQYYDCALPHNELVDLLNEQR